MLLCVWDSLCSNALPYDKQPLNKYCFWKGKIYAIEDAVYFYGKYLRSFIESKGRTN